MPGLARYQRPAAVSLDDAIVTEAEKTSSLCHVLWQFGIKTERFAGHRMLERQTPGVQALSRQSAGRHAAIQRIADQGVAQAGHCLLYTSDAADE